MSYRSPSERAKNEAAGYRRAASVLDRVAELRGRVSMADVVAITEAEAMVLRQARVILLALAKGQDKSRDLAAAAEARYERLRVLAHQTLAKGLEALPVEDVLGLAVECRVLHLPAEQLREIAILATEGRRMRDGTLGALQTVGAQVSSLRHEVVRELAATVGYAVSKQPTTLATESAAIQAALVAEVGRYFERRAALLAPYRAQIDALAALAAAE